MAAKNLTKLTILHSNDMHGDFLAENVDEKLVGSGEGVRKGKSYFHILLPDYSGVPGEQPVIVSGC